MIVSTLGFKEEKKPPAALNLTPKRSNSSSTDNSLKVPRTPRFAEATSVNSPVDMDKSPFADPEKPETGDSQQPGVVGFGYISNTHESSNGPKSPLKSAMKVPGTPARQFTNPLSPTFREEEVLEKREAQNDQQQANDVVRSPSRSNTAGETESLLMSLLVENQDACSNG